MKNELTAEQDQLFEQHVTLQDRGSVQTHNALSSRGLPAKRTDELDQLAALYDKQVVELISSTILTITSEKGQDRAPHHLQK